MPLFALLIALMTAFGGLAIDYARMSNVKSRIGSAVDAANLAAARAAADSASADPNQNSGETIASAEAIGRKYLESNLADLGSQLFQTLTLKVSYENGLWSAKTEFKAILPVTLSAVYGVKEIDFSGTSEASVTPGFPVLDIAMCIDSTGSMTPTLDAVKANALGFFDNLNAELAKKGISPFPLVRVRPMYFKDYGDSSGIQDPDPLVVSNFFNLPDDASAFQTFVAPQTAGGGADWAESGLECLNEAMDSPWVKLGDQPAGATEKVTDVYPLVIVWTDASSHPIAYPNSLANPDYPAASRMPRAYNAFLAKWNNKDTIDQAHKQILFFGDPAQPSLEPDGALSGWHEIMTWPNFVHGGTVTEANTSMIAFIADGVARSAKGLRLTN